MHYWDRISATQPAPEVLEAVTAMLSKPLGNAQSPQKLGSLAAAELETSRTRVASMINADLHEIVFTSNGTEANNLAILGLSSAVTGKQANPRRIIYSSIEHVSISKPVSFLSKQGFDVAVIPVDGKGRIDRARYMNALSEEVALVSIQLANPEIGTIQTLDDLVAAAHQVGAIFHTDAVAAAGWIPIDVKALDVDALSLAATSFHGIPGAGALFVRKGIRCRSVMYGGIQEQGKRPGTENIPAIVAMSIAAELAQVEMQDRMNRMRKLAGLLKDRLSHIEAVEFTGDWENRLPGHVSLVVDGVEGESLLLMLDMKGINAASGSSCTAKDLKISPVLTALGLDQARAQGSLVFSADRSTSVEDASAVIEALPDIIHRLRQMSPLWSK
ncbi:cysteine desulfurase [bacterium]|nr:cysteine desulfurase [candidate division CSSED10-310 bacterium]